MRKKMEKMKNPKVSVISPICNRERFLIRFLKSIQFQNFDDIEIILVDDKSTDNGVKILEEYQKKDKRIKIIKLKRNKGTFFARNIGVLYSQAKYIILPDPDDIISKDIINSCLYYAENYNFEIIRYHSYKGNKQLIKFDNEKSKPIYQPELQTYLFYANKELKRVDFYINNKMITKKLFIKALNLLNNFYLNLYMTILEDQLMIFILYKTAKSFYYLKKYGYYHKLNSISVCNNKFKLTHMRIRYYFIYIKLVYEYSKNIKIEKDIANYLFASLNSKIKIEKELSSSPFNNDFYFYYDIINTLLNCKFIFKDNKILLLKFKKIIEMRNRTFSNSINMAHL
jgi:glycosyltransferase involved in cell wall biosynthesis